jgi:type I restriction-modification system DNA methylase subunit
LQNAIPGKAKELFFATAILKDIYKTMNIAQIEINLQKLIATFNKQSFIYDLLLAYGLPKASITRLRKGNLNLSKIEREISWKKKLFFREEYKDDLHLTITEIVKGIKHNERFVIATDYKTLLAIDTKTNEKLDIALLDLPKHYDFFLPWAGMEKAQHADENPADVKAAEKMAKLFDIIKKDNPDDSPQFVHGLNVFLSRLLFCFFAEDTHIFEENQFTNALDSNTQKDGSDLNTFIDAVFYALNTPKQNRGNISKNLNAFPYVNGGLFEKDIKCPLFTRRSRQAIIDSGDLSWSAINPDIFGSMFQAVIGADQRGSLGQHYTSVPNIMKVIEPLFLNDLYEELDAAINSTPKLKKKKLEALLKRIYNLKIFDPACGSGNFLIIAYKELRILEMKIFKAGGLMALSGIELSQFYGIEIDDFAGEIAKLALWLAEHQMNVEFFKEFGRSNPTLPLKEAGKIVQGNATRLDWEEVCPKNKDGEIYILGNPPYLGARMQNKIQKSDMELVFGGNPIYKDSDYIACWFLKAAEYIKGLQASYAFVSTNSVAQGEQVAYYWPLIFNYGLEIFFAHQPFKWGNSAKANAGVTVVIIGLRNLSNKAKHIFLGQHKSIASNISPYLTNGDNVFVKRKSKILSNFLTHMSIGSMARDGGNLILTPDEKDQLLKLNPELDKIIHPLFGSLEFIQGKERFCLWIEDEQRKFAESVSEIKNRIQNVYNFRIESKAKTTNGYATIPHKFAQRCYQDTNPIIVPSTSSERREYIPIGYLNKGSVVTNSANVIYDTEPSLFGVLTSKMHNIWVKSVGGQLESRIRYSTEMVYNTFPFPQISTQRKNEITQAVFRILEEREKNSDKTLAQLYDPTKMPKGLREAHRQNDIIIEKCYRSTPFNSDEERLEYLFKLYEKMIAEEQVQGTLFAKEKKTRKKKQ